MGGAVALLSASAGFSSNSISDTFAAVDSTSTNFTPNEVGHAVLADPNLANSYLVSDGASFAAYNASSNGCYVTLTQDNPSADDSFTLAALDGSGSMSGTFLCNF